MEGELFFERYRICRDPEGKPQEAGRTGAAMTYKALDEQSNRPVALQLVPLAAMDSDRRDEFEARAKTVREIDHINVARVLDAGIQYGYFAFVNEYLPGETADSWLVAHGPMTADAVLRIGLQVVRATAAAAYHGLIHRAIQPSNIMILPGEAPTGGWPFVKLSNFGVAALELHGETGEARELAPAVVPQFASPEQVRNQQIDYRSEMYSLGATMCFLLTGAVPLPSTGDAIAKGRGRRRLPELRSMPKPVRRLLQAMLAENPEDRPQDPVILEGVMANCLGRVERRQALARRFGIPLAANVQRKIARSPSPVAQVFRGGLVFAALLIALAALGAILYPQYFHRAKSIDEIGVPVGVPMAETSTAASPVPAGNIVSTPKSTASPSPPQTQSRAVVQASPASSADRSGTASETAAETSSPAPIVKNAPPEESSIPAQTKVPPPPSSSTLANIGPVQQQQPVVSPVTPASSQSSAAQPAPASSGSLAGNPPPDNSKTASNTAKPITLPKATIADASSGTSAADREPKPPSERPVRQQPHVASPSTPPDQPTAAQAAPPVSSSSLTQNPPDDSTSATDSAKPITSSKTVTADVNAGASSPRDREPEPPSAAAYDEDASTSISQSKPSRATQPKVTTRSKTKTVTRNDSETRTPNMGRWSHAYFIGVTPSGRMLFRLPSGKIVAMRPGQRRAPVAVRPRYLRPPPDPQTYYGPPPYGYPPPPGYDY